MASDDIAQLTDALAKTHVGDGELSFRGLGLKLDNAAAGQKTANPGLFWGVVVHACRQAAPCPSSGGAGPGDRAAALPESPVSGGEHGGRGGRPGHGQSPGEQRHAAGAHRCLLI